MTSFEKQIIRAEIWIGGLKIETPNIESFSIHRARGQASATFSASVKVDYQKVSQLKVGEAKVVIKAGEGSLPTIFTGVIHSCTANPVRTDARLVMLNISGKDNMFIMEGQKINRRLTTYRDGATPPERWGVINSISKQNTPMRKRLPLKVFQPRTGLVGLSSTYYVPVDPAFPELKRGGPFQDRGGLSATKVVP
jgi:hypothetical protein